MKPSAISKNAQPLRPSNALLGAQSAQISQRPSPPPNLTDTLASLDNFDKVRLLGQLAQQDERLTRFRQAQLSSFSPNTTPPNFEKLHKLWLDYIEAPSSGLPSDPCVTPSAGPSKAPSAQETPSAPAQEDPVSSIQRQLLHYGLALTEHELRKQYDLAQVKNARTAWLSDITQARLNGDSTRLEALQNFGKDVFFAPDENERQLLLDRRYDGLRTFEQKLGENPEHALDWLHQINPEELPLPDSSRNLLISRAKRERAGRQERFARLLLENEMNGSPLGTDALARAEQNGYVTPDYAALYRERPSADSPLGSDPLLRLTLSNHLNELIDTYDPDHDPHGSRKRSIVALIALHKLPARKKRTLLNRLDEHTDDPARARLRLEAHNYITRKYKPAPDETYTPDSWLARQETLAKAHDAITDYLDTLDEALPSVKAWRELLPRLVYQAVKPSLRLEFTTRTSPDGQRIFDYPRLVPLGKTKTTETTKTIPPVIETPATVEISTTSDPRIASEMLATPELPQEDYAPGAHEAPPTWEARVHAYFREHPRTQARDITQDLLKLLARKP